MRYARNELSLKAPELLNRITSYRAGYTIEERRKIERGLFSGRLIGVTATNALELGVDVGGLDATILTGYPGTIASAWQQAGRAGRGGEPSLSIMVAFDNPLDQFLMRNPIIFSGAHTNAPFLTRTTNGFWASICSVRPTSAGRTGRTGEFWQATPVSP